MGTILLVFFSSLLFGFVFSVLSKITQIVIIGIIPIIITIIFLVNLIVDPAFIEHRQLLAWATGGLAAGTAFGW